MNLEIRRLLDDSADWVYFPLKLLPELTTQLFMAGCCGPAADPGEWLVNEGKEPLSGTWVAVLIASEGHPLVIGRRKDPEGLTDMYLMHPKRCRELLRWVDVHPNDD